MNASFRAIGSLVDGASYQFLSRTGFAQNQDCRIGRRHLSDLAQHFAQRFRGADDILEHRVTIDLLSQRQIFIACPLFGSDAVIDVSSRRVPASHLPLLISERVVTNEKPTILAVFPSSPLLNFERNATSESSLALVSRNLSRSSG